MFSDFSLFPCSARANATAFKIDAEGKASAVIIDAESKAKARIIEAKARNDAADSMNDSFAQEYALNGIQVEFASALKANVLSVLPASSVGTPLLNLAGQPSIPGKNIR